MESLETKDNEKPLRYIDTGKVKIGIYYVRPPSADTFCDMEIIQRKLLPKPLGPLRPWPSLRDIIRYWTS